MIPISELPEHSRYLASQAAKFDQQFTNRAGTHSEIRDIAMQFGEGIWCTVKPKLDYAVAATEHKFGEAMADGWIATLTVEGWMYHRGGISD